LIARTTASARLIRSPRQCRSEKKAIFCPSPADCGIETAKRRSRTPASSRSFRAGIRLRLQPGSCLARNCTMVAVFALRFRAYGGFSGSRFPHFHCVFQRPTSSLSANRWGSPASLIFCCAAGIS
jgi:hypothetical protein